jgi:adenylyltransferase/sulfurtransferase
MAQKEDDMIQTPASSPGLGDQDLLRYSRQILLPDFDIAGQEALHRASVLVVGLGGLGSPVALYLAAAGVGRLVLADDDVVELSNLPRQIVHTEASLGQSKVASAAQALRAHNGALRLECVHSRLDAPLLDHWVAQVDLVLDCCDNFGTRFALNRACLAHRTPWVSGAAIRSEGQVTVFDPRQPGSPCYQCLYPDLGDMQLSCSEAGVIAPLVGIIGAMQAMEAVKVLSRFGQPLVGRLQLLDAKAMQWRSLHYSKDPACSCAAG